MCLLYMYLEKVKRFYEIFKVRNKVYIHYGRIPNTDKQLPFGTFVVYDFKNQQDTNEYYKNQLLSKKKRGYDVMRTTQTEDMKWMRKNVKPESKVK